MLVLSPGFLRHVFFEEVVASAAPLSEPGTALERHMGAFLPGDEERLCAFWNDTDALRAWMKRHDARVLEGHLRNLQVRFLDADPSAWGPVELARLHSVAASTKWILENAAVCRTLDEPAMERATAALRHVLDILSPHCAGAGFHLSATPGSPLEQARARLKDANGRWMELERRQRAETAARLGIEPVRLKSDVTLPAGDPRLETFRTLPEMREVETSVHQVRFRFTVSGEARAAHDAMIQARRDCLELENAGIADLQERLRPHRDGLKNALAAAGKIDIHFVRARWAEAHDACRPEIASDGIITAAGAAHPHIERQVARLGRRYQRLDFRLVPPLSSLTGANMGGKTAFLRTVGLFQVLFQKGHFLPAKRFSGILVRSMAWIGAAPDAPQLGLSSFGRECSELAAAFGQPGPRLWLIDEFARSTSVEEGLALTGALMDALCVAGPPNHHIFAGHIRRPPVRTATAFHLHTGGLDFDAYQKHAASMEPAQALAASMDYGIHEGTSDSSDALRIARALGLPAGILEAAERLLHEDRNPAR